MEQELNYLSEKIESLISQIDSAIELKFDNWVEHTAKLDKELTICENILNALTINELK